MSDLPIDHWRGWIGREESVTDTIRPEPAAALAATLDRERPPGAGAPLPACWHWCYFLHPARASELGEDGHPRRGGFLPPVDLPRRMWAGGRLDFHRPLPIGARVTRRSQVADVRHKQGRSGDLVIVLVRHQYLLEAQPVLSEEHDILYRAAPSAGERPPAPPPAPSWPAQWRQRVQPDPVLLFRYSALTFNGHRIHYDREFCRGREAYPGLVVHGPLTATLLLEMLARERPGQRVTRFEFRAVSPLFDTEPFELLGRADTGGAELAAVNAAGGLAMSARASLAPAG